MSKITTTRKHPNIPNAKFDHTIAAYPLQFKKYVISPKKICLQFQDVQCKAREIGKNKDLRKTRHGTKELPIDTGATDIDVLAIGVPIHLYPEFITEMLTALKTHDELHPEESILKEIKEIIKNVQ